MSGTPVLFAADLHLGRSPWARLPELIEDGFVVWRSFVEVVSRLREDCGLRYVLFGGDFFDQPHVGPETIRRLLEVQANWPRDVALYHVVGQHDRHPEGDWLRELGVSRSMEAAGVVEIGRWRVVGRDNRPAPAFHRSIRDVRADIFLAHQWWEEITGYGALMSLKALEGRCRLLLTGDTHLPRCLDAWGLRAVSPGSMTLRAVDEPWEKKVALIRLPEDPAGEPAVEWISLPSRPVGAGSVRKRADIENLVRLADRLARPGPLGRPLLRVRYDPHGDGVSVASIAEALGNRAFLLASPFSQRDETDVVRKRESALDLEAIWRKYADRVDPGDLAFIWSASRRQRDVKEVVQELERRWREREGVDRADTAA